LIDAQKKHPPTTRLTILEHELTGGHVHADLDLLLEAGLADGLHEQLHALVVGLDGRGETTLITDIAGILTVLGLDDGLQGGVDLCEIKIMKI
jgi:hypothetical protein